MTDDDLHDAQDELRRLLLEQATRKLAALEKPSHDWLLPRSPEAERELDGPPARIDWSRVHTLKDLVEL